MKHFLRLSLLALLCYSSQLVAQLPDGSIAPDFTVMDIDGNEHTLSTYLNDGKTVVIHFACTWTGPAWNYHQEGAMQELHSTYGPNGSDDMVVLMIEGDDQTTLEDLQGTGDNSIGDWLEGTEFPVIESQEIFELYENDYYPTIY